jgi:DNA processing protein
VTTVVHLAPLDPAYPSRLRTLAQPPSTLSVRGGALQADRVVAIVGSRAAHPDTMELARDLAGRLARAGAVVASGGAVGIDASAHLGALDAGGRTWAVAPTGCNHCFPPSHADLFDRIGCGPGVMLWPFAPDYHQRSGFVARNRVLVALSDAVVVVQAGAHSGALHAAACAGKLGRPLWVVPAPPWRQRGFEGTHALVDSIERSRGGAHPVRPLTSIERFVAAMGLPALPGAPLAARARSLSGSEAAVFDATSTVPLHLDEIASRSHCPPGTVSAVLLTLALEDVVVEDPPGYFRRRDDC